MTPLETKFDNFLKGFYGALDVSVDYTTKGINNPNAYNYYYANGAPGSPYVITSGPKATPYGRVGWLGAMSSNGSSIGYRGSHRIPNSDIDFIYQVSTSINMVAAPGLENTWTKSIERGSGGHRPRRYLPRLPEPFLGQGQVRRDVHALQDLDRPAQSLRLRLGNYAVIMGNTGGDNRVEFGTRSDDVVSYSSPTWGGFSFDAAYAFGQQIDPNSDLTPLGSPDCAGTNIPGSGNLFLNCDDGGYDQAFSGDLKFETGGLYLVGGLRAAQEGEPQQRRHRRKPAVL